MVMRFSGSRRSATRVRGGRTQKKNNWRPDSSNYFALSQRDVRVERRSPGPGFRHLITVGQLRAFLDLLPEWGQVAVGLDAVVLDAGREHVMGWHHPHIVGVCAWEQDLWWEDGALGFEREHKALLDRLGVERTESSGQLQVRWTDEQARAFQLLHILPHELGHHHDRVTTRRQNRGGRGEPYAETYALRIISQVWDAYVTQFGFVGHIT